MQENEGVLPSFLIPCEIAVTAADGHLRLMNQNFQQFEHAVENVDGNNRKAD